MKIILLGTAHPYRGGLASYNERLTRQFLSEGHDVQIYTFTLQYPRLFFPGKTQFTETDPPAGIRITRLLNSVNPLSWIRTGRKIRKEDPDIILIKYWHPFMAPCFGTVVRIAGKKRTGKSKEGGSFSEISGTEKSFTETNSTEISVKGKSREGESFNQISETEKSLAENSSAEISGTGKSREGGSFPEISGTEKSFTEKRSAEISGTGKGNTGKRLTEKSSTEISGTGKRRIICIFDNVIPHEKKPFDKMLTSYFTKSIDGAVVMSQSVGEDLRKFRTDIPVVYNPHPLFDNYGDLIPREDAIRKLDLPAGYSFLLFFGFIRAYKGLDILIRAFGDDNLRKFKLKLIIAGEFYESDLPYRNLMMETGIKDDVILFDRFIREDEVSLFFSAADLVVQPYRSATQSGVTQIAYHFGKPMVVTDVGGLSEIVADGKCGYVVKPEPEYVTNAIIDYFSNNRKSSFTEGVKQERSRFTWDKLTAAITRVYESIGTEDEKHSDEQYIHYL